MRALLRLLPIILLIAGCATGPVSTTDRPIGGKGALAYAAFDRGDYRTAARAFTEVATDAQPPQRADYRLMAVRSLLRLELVQQARDLLTRVEEEETLTAEQHMRIQLLHARLALKQRRGDEVLTLLGSPLGPSMSPEIAAEFHQLLAEAYRLQSNHLEAAREFTLREPFLTEADAVLANQHQIWQDLSTLSDQVLSMLETKPAPDVLSGWMELVRLAKSGGEDEESLRRRVAAWERRYPNHPAQPAFRELVIRHARQLLERPRQIAVLLPLTGKFAEPAQAVRDGIFHAYYHQKEGPHGFRLRVYDVGPNPAGVLAAYDQAIGEGAEFVIGPLRKEAVNILAQRDELPVPTLALNYAEGPSRAPANMYEFSLAPEEEARQVAERAWLDGRSRAAVIIPQGNWGQRILSAFDERWRQLGGQSLAQTTYDPAQHDYSKELKAMLHLDHSYNRYRRVRQILGAQLKFEPRRRQDVDFIFMAAFPPQGRLIQPQLKFHHAAHVPIYSTSHLFTGKVAPELDRDVNGVIFGDMPWTLKGNYPPGLPYSGSLQRLVAMGIDAYSLIPSLPILSQYPHERFQGVTGTLRVDEGNRVRRQMLWAHFVSGRPRVLEPETDLRAR